MRADTCSRSSSLGACFLSNFATNLRVVGCVMATRRSNKWCHPSMKLFGRGRSCRARSFTFQRDIVNIGSHRRACCTTPGGLKITQEVGENVIHLITGRGQQCIERICYMLGLALSALSLCHCCRPSCCIFLHRHWPTWNRHPWIDAPGKWCLKVCMAAISKATIMVSVASSFRRSLRNWRT